MSESKKENNPRKVAAVKALAAKNREMLAKIKEYENGSKMFQEPIEVDARSEVQDPRIEDQNPKVQTKAFGVIGALGVVIIIGGITYLFTKKRGKHGKFRQFWKLR